MVDYRKSGDPVTKPQGNTIGEHGVIGDMTTMALVGIDGAIDFLCWPRLESESVFATLLNPEEGGFFQVRPAETGLRARQYYLTETAVLVTSWQSEEAGAELTDYMVHPDVSGGDHMILVRRLRVTRGTMAFRMVCDPRFGYGTIVPNASKENRSVIFDGHVFGSLRLTADVHLVLNENGCSAAFEMNEGEEVTFRLSPPEVAVDERDELAGTSAAWREWMSASTYRGRWREAVHRSAITLKLLTSRRHGSTAAAATFGLPEQVGGERNWDYRATWIRDASFTVYAFLRLGFVEEAERFRSWVDQRVQETAEGETLRVMYALDGNLATDEKILDKMTGYGGSTPVRIGNQARQQTQLDIFGELLDSAYLANKYGEAISWQGWDHVTGIVNHVCENWETPDAGIWEFRSTPRHNLHSRVMCWVAIDRALRLAQKRSLPAPFDRWTSERDKIARDIWTNFRHPEGGYFVQDKGGTEVDAALLMMPLVRFVSATDPIWLKTLDAINDQLGDDGLIRRYRTDDGLKTRDGPFVACTFWYVECLARAGRLAEASRIMEKAMLMANPLDLFAEEVDTGGEPMGNFPQALSHLAFISAAYFLDRKLDGPKQGEWQP